ncbi:hypothetical protein [Deinococcus cavernae]|nr:hypothetical protein [Deinococcus cavernae]
MFFLAVCVLATLAVYVLLIVNFLQFPAGSPQERQLGAGLLRAMVYFPALGALGLAWLAWLLRRPWLWIVAAVQFLLRSVMFLNVFPALITLAVLLLWRFISGRSPRV